MAIKYHDPDSCNKCSGQNRIIETSFEGGIMSEAKTKCTECGFEDYWAYGWFESGAEIESKCKTYSFNHDL